MKALTKSQTAALKWLRERTGDGGFDRYGVLVACGERAPFERRTWNALRDAGLVEFYRIAETGYGRARLSQGGST